MKRTTGPVPVFLSAWISGDEGCGLMRLNQFFARFIVRSLTEGSDEDMKIQGAGMREETYGGREGKEGGSEEGKEASAGHWPVFLTEPSSQRQVVICC